MKGDMKSRTKLGKKHKETGKGNKKLCSKQKECLRKQTATLRGVLKLRAQTLLLSVVLISCVSATKPQGQR